MKTLVAMIVCVTVIIASVAILVLGPGGGNSSQGAAATPKVRPGTVLMSQSGTSAADTAVFTVGSKWQLVWRYDCTGAPFGSGAFAVRLYDGSRKSADYVNRDVHSSGAQGAGIEHYTAGNSHKKLLSIQTTCRWGVIVDAG
jgi:hypothetical protein